MHFRKKQSSVLKLSQHFNILWLEFTSDRYTNVPCKLSLIHITFKYKNLYSTVEPVFMATEFCNHLSFVTKIHGSISTFYLEMEPLFYHHK